MVLQAVREARLDSRFESSALVSLYNDLGPADLSKDILAHVAGQSLVLRLEGVDWCDWGHPQRVTEALARVGQRPIFESERLGSAQASAIAGKGGGI